MVEVGWGGEGTCLLYVKHVPATLVEYEHHKAIYLFQKTPCSPCGTILFKLIANRWAWGWCLLECVVVPGRATSLEQGTQISMATLRAATTQSLAPRVLGRAKGPQTEMTWDLCYHPEINQAPSPGLTRDTQNKAYPKYGNADHEMKLDSPFTIECFKEALNQGPQLFVRPQDMIKHPPAAYTESGTCLGLPGWLEERLLRPWHKQAVNEPDNPRKTNLHESTTILGPRCMVRKLQNS